MWQAITAVLSPRRIEIYYDRSPLRFCSATRTDRDRCERLLSGHRQQRLVTVERVNVCSLT